MKILSGIILGLFMTLSLGCVATLPPINANGRFQIFSFNERPIVEYEYPTADACAFDANKILLNLDSRKAILSGNLKIECSNTSIENILTYRSLVKNVLTGEVYPTKTYSKEGCEFIAKLNKDQRLKHYCTEN